MHLQPPHSLPIRRGAPRCSAHPSDPRNFFNTLVETAGRGQFSVTPGFPSAGSPALARMSTRRQPGHRPTGSAAPMDRNVSPGAAALGTDRHSSATAPPGRLVARQQPPGQKWRRAKPKEINKQGGNRPANVRWPIFQPFQPHPRPAAAADPLRTRQAVWFRFSQGWKVVPINRVCTLPIRQIDWHLSLPKNHRPGPPPAAGSAEWTKPGTATVLHSRCPRVRRAKPRYNRKLSLSPWVARPNTDPPARLVVAAPSRAPFAPASALPLSQSRTPTALIRDQYPFVSGKYSCHSQSSKPNKPRVFDFFLLSPPRNKGGASWVARKKFVIHPGACLVVRTDK